MRLCVLLVVSLLAGCAGQGYELEFHCASNAGPSCPLPADCPEVPLGSGGCEDLPSLFNHPAIHVDVGRPEGCVASLPYVNPYYAGQGPQTCACTKYGDVKLSWLCPL